MLDGDDSALATHVRLWLLGDDVPVSAVERALPLDDAAGLLRRDGNDVRAAYDLRPYAADDRGWWILSDRTRTDGGPVGPDHVVGIGPAAVSLAQLTVRRPVRRALDLGTGSGVQALHLSAHAGQVTATDISSRAMTLAATTFALNNVDVRLLQGDFIEPVADEQFDLVVCNPPFVMGPETRYVYRDGVSRRAVCAAAAVLAEGGVAQLLVNWLHRDGEDWRDHLASWVSDLGCDAWILQRDVVEPHDYVSMWLADAGDVDDIAMRTRWLHWFAEQRAHAAAVGWVVLRRTTSRPTIVIDDVPQQVEMPLGETVADWLDRIEWLRNHDDQGVLGTAFRVAPGLRCETSAAASDDGWRPVDNELVLTSGLRWRLPCDDAVAGLVAGCDGFRPLALLAEVLATSTGWRRDEIDPDLCATVRALVERGVLLPPR